MQSSHLLGAIHFEQCWFKMECHINCHGNKINTNDVVKLTVPVKHPDQTESCFEAEGERLFRIGRVRKFLSPAGKANKMMAVVEEIRYLGTPEHVIVNADHLVVEAPYDLKDPPRGRDIQDAPKGCSGW